MNIIKIIRFLIKAKNEHFISVEDKTYRRYKFLIKLTISLNNNYRMCEIHRRKFKSLKNFVVVGLKYSGKNVKRRTSGYAKEFIDRHRNAKCLYCESKLTHENATADHIVPISMGGNNTQVNLVVVCKSCNEERGNLNFYKYIKIKNPKYKSIKFI